MHCPGFVYANTILAGMAAFKRHVCMLTGSMRRYGEDSQCGGMGNYGEMTAMADMSDRCHG